MLGEQTAHALRPPHEPQPWKLAAVQYADDFKAILPSASAVPSFLDAMATFGKASGQLLNMSKTSLLHIGVGTPPPSIVHDLTVTTSATALGITFHFGTLPPQAPWQKLVYRVERCYTRVAGVSMSAFGRGIASAAYGASQLLSAA